jgi:hypothetical protein
MPDGLPGRAFVVSRSFKPDGTMRPYDHVSHGSFNVYDVPVGRYSVSARAVKPDGTARDLMLTARSLTFPPAQTPALSQIMDFQAGERTEIHSASLSLFILPTQTQ